MRVTGSLSGIPSASFPNAPHPTSEGIHSWGESLLGGIIRTQHQEVDLHLDAEDHAVATTEDSLLRSAIRRGICLRKSVPPGHHRGAPADCIAGRHR